MMTGGAPQKWHQPASSVEFSHGETVCVEPCDAGTQLLQANLALTEFCSSAGAGGSHSGERADLGTMLGTVCVSNVSNIAHGGSTQS